MRLQRRRRYINKLVVSKSRMRHGKWIPDCWTGRGEGTRTKLAATNTWYSQFNHTTQPRSQFSLARVQCTEPFWMASSSGSGNAVSRPRQQMMTIRRTAGDIQKTT